MQLNVGKVYLFAGHHDIAAKRMVLNFDGWIRKWKQGTYRQIKNWQGRLNQQQQQKTKALFFNRTKKGTPLHNHYVLNPLYDVEKEP